DAGRSTYFILTAIALADVAVIVEHNVRNLFLEHGENITCFGDKFGLILQKREDRCTDRGNGRWQFQIDSLFSPKLIFDICRKQNCEKRAVDSKRRLDNMRNESFF